MATHYQAAIIPARPLRPQDKSIAENAVLVASRWIIARLAQQRFYSLNALNNAIAGLLEALNKKPFQKRQGSRLQQFEEVERAQLQPLPQSTFEIATQKQLKVPPDYHLRLHQHYYSVPYAFTGEVVLCRITQTTVEIFHEGQRIASHLRAFEPDGKSTIPEHMPKQHREYQQWTPQVFLAWAENTGPSVRQVVDKLLESQKHPQLCSKLHAGFKHLCRHYGSTRLNHACERALVLDCVKYKSIRSLLKSGLDGAPAGETMSSSEPSLHANVRGANYYQQS